MTKQISGMNDKETKEWLLKWCENHTLSPYSWPTDACGYHQHIKFVQHRNANWTGTTEKEFVEFVKEYANNLS